MYKHVAKFTKELREFSYDNVDLTAAIKQQEMEEEEELMREIEGKDDDKQFFCSLCKKWVSSLPNNMRNHANSRGHSKRLKKWKRIYRKFMEESKSRTLLQRRPKNVFWRRLLYYRMLHNFEAEV